MKNRLKLWLGLAGVVALASVALADYNVQDKGTYYNNASTGLRTTSQGHLTTQEQDPAMDANLTFQSIISQSTLAAGGADSSAILDTHRMRLGMLLLKATPTSVTGADSLATIRLGVQIRTHLNAQSDSSSTFAFYMYGRSDQGGVAAASQIDTSAVGHIFNAVNLAASANSVYSGEFVVYVQVSRTAVAATSAFGGLGARTFYYPNGLAIPLQSIFGREIFSPYTSIRIRNLGTIGPANRSCIVTAHLVGTPL